MSTTRKVPGVGQAAVFFALVTVLAFISGSIAPLWRIFGVVLAVITVLLALRWWITVRAARRV